jgi:hypothetical protein
MKIYTNRSTCEESRTGAIRTVREHAFPYPEK